VYDAEDMLADPHFVARESIISIDDGDGPTPMQGCFPKLSRTPGAVRRPAPREVGQDKQDILTRWLGAEAPGQRAKR
jgi:formyl-CoA transferase